MKKSRYKVTAISLLSMLVVLGILSGFKGFCDWYRGNIYSGLSDVITTLTDPIPFSLGEISIYVGIILVFCTLIIVLLLFVFRKKQGMIKFSLRWMKGISLIILFMLVWYMFTWVFPFRASTKIEEIQKETFTFEELQTLRDYIVNQINTLVLQQERDADGRIIYPEDMEEQVITAMQCRAVDYPLLGGKYPRIKMAGFSRILHFMNIGGYTYPYTMEVTCNKYVDKLYFPSLMAHEHSHHQGFYQEDEANFYAYVSLVESDNSFLAYAGYWTTYFDVEDEYMSRLYDTFSDKQAEKIYNERPQICKQAVWDHTNSRKDSQAYVDSEKNEVVDSFSPYASDVADVGWSVQADLLEENYYEGVVALVLDYYKGKLYD